MKKISLKDVNSAKTPHKVNVRKLFSFEHATIANITLKPGEELLKHITPVDAIFYGIKGKGMVEIGDETETMSPGDLVFSPKKIVHRLLNNTENTEEFEFLVIKVPTPTSETKIL